MNLQPKRDNIARLEQQIRNLKAFLQKQETVRDVQWFEIRQEMDDISTTLFSLGESGDLSSLQIGSIQQQLSVIYDTLEGINSGSTGGTSDIAVGVMAAMPIIHISMGSMLPGTRTFAQVIPYYASGLMFPGLIYTLGFSGTNNNFVAKLESYSFPTSAVFSFLTTNSTKWLQTSRPLYVAGNNQHMIYRNTGEVLKLADGTDLHKLAAQGASGSVVGGNIFIQANQPTNPQIGDVWLQIT